MQINLLNYAECEMLRGLIADAEHIVVCGHRSPDGDAMGSSLGWSEYLKGLGKNVEVVMPDLFPDFLQWLPNADGILRYDKKPDEVAKTFDHADLICCMDFGQSGRVDSMSALIDNAKAPIVLIDHHPDPTIKTRMKVSRPELSSTSEVVFRLIWQLGGFECMTRQAAVDIYCGMMTDTGGFTFNSNRPEIFFIISQLLTKGINKDRIYRNVYHNYSEQRVRLMGFVLYKRLHVNMQKRVCYYILTRQDLKRFNFKKGDAEGLVNIPLQIKGMRLSISLREDTERDHLIWVSLRSVDNLSCTKIAEKYFNGGGHFNASGGRLECTPQEAEIIVQRAIEEM